MQHSFIQKVILFILIVLATPTLGDEGLTGKVLYESLNLRSFPSSVGQDLKRSCYTTAQDYFVPGKEIIVKMDQDSLQIETEIWFYSFKIHQNISAEVVSFSDKAKFSTYNSVSELTLERDKTSSRWVAVRSKTIYPEWERQVREIEKKDWISYPHRCEESQHPI